MHQQKKISLLTPAGDQLKSYSMRFNYSQSLNAELQILNILTAMQSFLFSPLPTKEVRKQTGGFVDLQIPLTERTIMTI